MKRILLAFLVIFAYSQMVVAQIGVGTEDPHVSAQLDVFSAEHGILIPRVPLNSTIDQATIRNGNVNSLMVFNTQTINDVTPGYYYWYETKWYRLVSTSDALEETITTLIDQGNGQFLYTSEDGTETTIDIPASVVYDIINEGAIYNEIIKLIGSEETITVLEDHGNGRYTYYNETQVDADGAIIGPGVTIDVIGDVVTNIQNDGVIYDQITNVIQAEQATTTLVDGTNTSVVVNPPNPAQPNNAEYAVNVATADGTNLGVVKEAADNPTVSINEEGELSVNITNLHAIVETSVDYSPVFDTDATILGNAVANDVSITLPDATPDTKGKKYTIKKLDANEANYIFVLGNIAGTSGQVLYTGVPYTGWDFISDGTVWHIVNSF